MKNYLFFGIALLSFALSSTLMVTPSEQGFENITAAVKASDVKEVQNFLDLCTLDAHQKKSLLEEATTILIEKKQNVIFQNPRNSAKATILGTALATYGSLAGAFIIFIYFVDEKRGMYFRDKKTALNHLKEDLFIEVNRLTQFLCLSLTLSLGAGSYLINKGLSYATGVAVCNDAEKIKELIKQVEVE